MDLEPDVAAAHQLFAKLAGVVYSEESVQSILALICTVGRDAIPGTTGAGITLIRDDRPFTAAYTDDLVTRADSLQYDLGEGPCLSSWRDQTVNRVDSFAAESRWPRYAAAVAPQGVHSIVSAPVTFRDDPLGALKVYSTEVGAFGETAEHLVVLLADQAAITLANTLSYRETETVTSQLREALETRQTIGQAMGMLMERHHVGPDAAFDMLRNVSQRTNVKLRDVAARLVQQAPEEPS